MKKIYLLLLILNLPIFCFSQERVIAFKVISKTYNTSRLNVNSVALKSITIIGYESDIQNALFKSLSKYFDNWLGNVCNYGMLSMDQIMQEYPAGNYKSFPVEKGKVYLIIDSPKDFIKTYNSFSIGKLQSPTPPPPPNKVNQSNGNEDQYKHVEFCKPEIDACISLCVKKKEASFEVCCNDICTVIKFDGEIKLSVDLEIK